MKSGLKDGNSTGSWTFIFKGNSATYIEKWSEPGSGDDIETYNGTFETNEGTIYMHLVYGNDTYDWSFNYSINGKHLNLSPADSETQSYFRMGGSTITFTKK